MVLFICSFAGHPQGARLGQGSGDTAAGLTQSLLSGTPHILMSQPAAPAAQAVDEKSAPLASPGLAKQAPPLGPSGTSNGFEMDWAQELGNKA